MVTPVSISNYISLPDDFPVRNIAPQVKEVLKDFIDALSTIICDEEWRTSLNINSATKKIFNNLDNLSYIQRTSFRGNDTLYNEKVQFKLTYPVKNGRHKENIEKGIDSTYEEVLKDVNQRDYQDSHREIAPLKPAEDSVLVDTSDYDFEGSKELLLKVIKERM